MQDHLELRSTALLKLTVGPGGGARVRLNWPIQQILARATLSEQDLAILDHFVNSRADALLKTVYYEGVIYYPVPRKVLQHKLKRTHL